VLGEKIEKNGWENRFGGWEKGLIVEMGVWRGQLWYK